MLGESIMNFLTKKARALRQQQTKAENKLWQILRNRKILDLKFRRQHPIRNYIVDFCCLKARLIIELDGEFHNNAFQQHYDEKRSRILQNLGYIILRFENNIVFEQPELLLREIENSLTPGRGRYKILSTKKLSQQQIELFEDKFQVEMYNAISIEKLPFEHLHQIENAIVTSQNSAQILIDSFTHIKNVFCVGDKTSNLLRENNYNVVKTTNNASDLANFIVKKRKNDTFVFFCGNLRRNELPEILSENQVDFTEITLYKTHQNQQLFNTNFEGVLFFSPSGVKSYIQENVLTNSVAFCIGNTTAKEAKKHASEVVTASRPTIENTIKTLNGYFKS